MLAAPRNFPECRPQVRVPRVCLRLEGKVCIYLKGMCLFKSYKMQWLFTFVIIGFKKNRLGFIIVSSQEYCVEAISVPGQISSMRIAV